jgi:hypothetical protein
MGLVDWSKDKLAQGAINKALDSIGSIEDLKIDREGKTISGRLNLEGEKMAISITIIGYELGTGANRNKFRFTGIEANRPWLREIGTRYLVGRWFAIPSSAGAVL